jgi:hypothetical protein
MSGFLFAWSVAAARGLGHEKYFGTWNGAGTCCVATLDENQYRVLDGHITGA